MEYRSNVPFQTFTFTSIFFDNIGWCSGDGVLQQKCCPLVPKILLLHLLPLCPRPRPGTSLLYRWKNYISPHNFKTPWHQNLLVGGMALIKRVNFSYTNAKCHTFVNLMDFAFIPKRQILNFNTSQNTWYLKLKMKKILITSIQSTYNTT